MSEYVCSKCGKKATWFSQNEGRGHHYYPIEHTTRCKIIVREDKYPTKFYCFDCIKLLVGQRIMILKLDNQIERFCSECMIRYKKALKSQASLDVS